MILIASPRVVKIADQNRPSIFPIAMNRGSSSSLAEAKTMERLAKQLLDRSERGDNI